MKRIGNISFAFASLFMILFLLPITGIDETVEFTGWVSDSACAAKHTSAGGKDCVEKCIKGGADIGHPEWTPQERVFVEENQKKVWSLTNPEFLKGYEGERVHIRAKIAKDDSKLGVTEVSRIESKQSGN